MVVWKTLWFFFFRHFSFECTSAPANQVNMTQECQKVKACTCTTYNWLWKIGAKLWTCYPLCKCVFFHSLLFSNMSQCLTHSFFIFNFFIPHSFWHRFTKRSECFRNVCLSILYSDFNHANRVKHGNWILCYLILLALLIFSIIRNIWVSMCWTLLPS